jgi:hypothetical protein
MLVVTHDARALAELDGRRLQLVAGNLTEGTPG